MRPDPSIAERHRMMKLHLDDMLTHYGAPAMRLARKHIAWYAHGLPGAAELRDVANNTTDAEAVFEAVDRFFAELDEGAQGGGGLMDEIASPDLQLEATHILASLPNPVFLLDGADRFVFLNHAAEMFFDSSATMLTGSELSQQIPADSSLMALLARARSQMASVADQGIELASPRIGMKLLNVQIAPFGDRSAHEGRMLVTFQERALAERLRGQSLFHGAARSISAMAALLAHEVKNPLAGIKGAAQLLQADLSPENQEFARMIVEETNRVTALLDRMEGIAGGGQVSLSPVNIHEVLDHCLRIASASYGAHMSVRRRYDPSLPPVDGHRDLLIQAFLKYD